MEGDWELATSHEHDEENAENVNFVNAGYPLQMGKKTKPSLGKSIIRQRAKGSRSTKDANSWLHCSELDTDAGPDLKSITEQSALDDFLATAELAGTEFTAEKLNTTVVTPVYNEGLVSSETAAAIKQAQEDHQHFLRIPRRPQWDEEMTAEELDQKEKETFLQWRRQLAQLQEKDHILLTPFERNLDFWRQLWRVIERSDIVVQIVDARNPLLFRCEDLENYVTDIGPKKCNLLLINKADFLSPEQRESWARHFKSIGLPVAFWSAQQENERLLGLRTTDDGDTQKKKEKENKLDCEKHQNVAEKETERIVQTATLWSKLSEMAVDNENEGTWESQRSPQGSSDVEANCSLKSEVNSSGVLINPTNDSFANVTSPKNCTKGLDYGYMNVHSNVQNNLSCHSEVSAQKQVKDSNSSGTTFDSHSQNSAVAVVDTQPNSDQKNLFNEMSAKLLTREELLSLFKVLHMKKVQNTLGGSQKVLTTVGLVGYPNVGKSSTINTLLNDKKVPVSATPGRTKHFQTLYINDEVLLCDCPGLVFPSFVSTKAEMILNGILPIDQMRDHVPAVSLLCQRIPRGLLEVVYGINIASPQEGENPNRAPYANELLSAYGYIRGYMTSHGIPDCSRSARYILKDYVRGKLLYCIAPPGQDESEFQLIGYKLPSHAQIECKEQEAKNKAHKQISDVDKNFFKQEQVRCFSRGFHTAESRHGVAPPQETGAIPYKPWKKHHNKNKREKLRRLVKK